MPICPHARFALRAVLRTARWRVVLANLLGAILWLHDLPLTSPPHQSASRICSIAFERRRSQAFVR